VDDAAFGAVHPFYHLSEKPLNSIASFDPKYKRFTAVRRNVGKPDGFKTE
jgi:hypothetical protein